MRVMALDIGTNSTLHLVADIIDGDLRVVERGIIRNRLGAEVGEDGVLGADLLDHNRQILAGLAGKAKAFGCERVGAAGTHALRKAANGEDFLKMAESCGIPLVIISDEEEGRLAWQGVFGGGGRQADDRKPLALLDVGGGSSELSLGHSEAPNWSDSVPLGGVALCRKFFRHDPPQKEQIRAAEEHIRTVFEKWRSQRGEFSQLVGIAGSAYALACLSHSITDFLSGAVEGLGLTAESIREWRDRLLQMDLAERQTLESMPPARAESIAGGALIWGELLEILDVRTITVSERGLIFGLALRLGK